MAKLYGLFIFLALLTGSCGEKRTGNSAPRPGAENKPANNMDASDEQNRTGDSSQRFYGEKITFWQDQPVKLRDFNLTYIGKRQVAAERPRPANGGFPSRTFTYYDFKIESGSDEQTISWSSGTGDIAPVRFTVGGQDYELELGMSDKLGKLAEDELVVWKK